MGIEVEIKLELLNASEVIKNLAEMSQAKFMFEEHQIDTYYNPPHKNYVENTNKIIEWFRLRQVNGKSSLNYKDYTPVTHCIEHETFVGSAEDAENIIKCLGFKEIVGVDKLRKSWMFGDIEISIDEVKNLGCYIELEYKGHLTDDAIIRQKLFALLKTIGAQTAEEDHKGYPWLLICKQSAA